MKTNNIAALSAALSALALAPVAFGQIYYDANGTDNGSGVAAPGGNGANLITTNWVNTPNNGTSPGRANWTTVESGGTQNSNVYRWADVPNTNVFFGGTAGTVNVNAPVAANSVTFSTSGYTIAGTSSLTVAGNITTGTGITATITAPLSGAVTKSGAGTLSFGASNQALTGVTLEAGTLSGTGTLTANAINVLSGTVSVNLAGTGTLTKDTAGDVVLSGSNSYTGYTEVLGGKLTISTPAALPSTSAVYIDSGATLALGSGGSYSAGTLTLGSGGGTIDFNDITGSLTFTGYSQTGVADIVNYTHSGSSFIRFTGVTAGFTNWFTIDGEAAAFAANGDLILASAIPEPSSVALLGALGALGFAVTRRRRSVQA